MSKMKVLVTATNYSQYCAEAKELLETNGCEVIENPYGRPMTFQELTEYVPNIDAVVAGVDTWNEDVFRIAPNLKVIARFGVGVDNIDLVKAAEYGVQVMNAPGLNSNAVAELTMGLIIAVKRNTVHLNASTREGKWERFVGTEVLGKTIGLLGFGSIAQLVAKKLQGFDVKILAYDKYPNLEKAAQYHVEMVSLETVLRQSDVVSMLLPSLPETYHIMNDEKFGMMKDGAVFINTARGALVDEQALYRALTSGKLASAAIDVYEHEPVDPNNPLLQLPNIITTPHTAAETIEVYHSIGLATAQAVLDVFNGKVLPPIK